MAEPSTTEAGAPVFFLQTLPGDDSSGSSLYGSTVQPVFFAPVEPVNAVIDTPPTDATPLIGTGRATRIGKIRQALFATLICAFISGLPSAAVIVLCSVRNSQRPAPYAIVGVFAGIANLVAAVASFYANHEFAPIAQTLSASGYDTRLRMVSYAAYTAAFTLVVSNCLALYPIIAFFDLAINQNVGFGYVVLLFVVTSFIVSTIQVILQLMAAFNVKDLRKEVQAADDY